MGISGRLLWLFRLDSGAGNLPVLTNMFNFVYPILSLKWVLLKDANDADNAYNSNNGH